jgi:hypothetical protein
MLRAVLAEIVGLFVDDGSLASGVLVVVGAAALLALRLHAPSVLSGVVLLVGCLAVLAQSVARAKRKR